MNINDYWDNFCKSGSIESYLEYVTQRDKAGNRIGTDKNTGLDTKTGQPQ